MSRFAPPRDTAYGYSSQTMFSPGLDSTEIDHMVLRPHTSWRGVRGVRANFGSDDSRDPSYGRLYASAGHHELYEASEADVGTLLGRSGNSGYRGGRPTFGQEGSEDLPRFGAKVEIHNVGMYEGNEVGVFFIALGALAVGAKVVGAF